MDNDSLCTPRWILDIVRAMGPIALDPCSNPWSSVGAIYECSWHDRCDGLADPWHLFDRREGLIWCNPPYSRPAPWVERAIEARSEGHEILMLMKNDPSTKWSARLRETRDAKCDFHRRISFEGGLHKTGVAASTLWYLGPRPYLFAHLFDAHGEVRVYR